MNLKRNGRFKKSMAAFLCSAVVVSGTWSAMKPESVFAYADVDALQQQIDALEAENAAAQKKLEGVKDDISAKEEEQKLLEEKKDNAQQQVVLYSQKLAKLNENIAQNEEDIAAKQTDIEEHTELFGQRVRAMYMSSQTSTLELLFRSTSFSEFLSQVETLRRISKFDNNLIATLKEEKADLLTLQEELAAQQTDLELTKQQYLDKVKELDFSITEVQASQQELQAMAEEYQQNIEENEEEAAKLEEETAALIRKYEEEERKRKEEEERKRKEEEERKRQEELRRQQEAANNSSSNSSSSSESSNSSSNSSSSNTGNTSTSEHYFAWPLPSSNRITSYFGPRYVFGANNNHGAIDIAAPKESAIVAAKSGTVIAAGPSGTTYGTYVIISHGDGYSTLYAHCNSVNVSVGDYVSQGQRIAGVGTTGRSTGYHLHFEVRVNGTRVDPLNYVSKPW